MLCADTGAHEAFPENRKMELIVRFISLFDGDSQLAAGRCSSSTSAFCPCDLSGLHRRASRGRHPRQATLFVLFDRSIAARDGRKESVSVTKPLRLVMGLNQE